MRGRGGGRRLTLARIALLLLVGCAAACKRPDPELMPESMLRDSLGLGDEDRVHRVHLSGADNRELVEPASVEVRPGDYVEFITTDRRVHAIAFELDSLPPVAVEFLRGTSQEGSPPLVEPDARFLVTFAGAPTGRYPFLVVGNGSQARGLVVVAESRR